MKYIVINLTPGDQEMIAHALSESSSNNDTVHVMIQEDGLKFKLNYGTWSPPIGTIER